MAERYLKLILASVDAKERQMIAHIFTEVEVEARTVYKYEMPDFLWIRKHWAAR